jgi:flagellar hook-length control protein FliK
VPTLSPLPTAQTPTAPGDPTAVDVISPAGFTLPVLPKAERARPAAAAPTATPIDSTIAVLPAAPLTAARPVAAPTAAASAPVEVPTAQQQVAGAIASLRTAADGTHHIVLQLHPEDLGPVNIVARLSHGDLSISLATTGDAARAALHDGVSQLRDDLHQAGFTGVAVSVDAGDAGDASARGERFGTFANDRASGRAGDSPTTADTQPRTRSISSRDGVDRWL